MQQLASSLTLFEVRHTLAGEELFINVTETGMVDFSRFAVAFNASSATPGRQSSLSVTLTPPQPAFADEAGSAAVGIQLLVMHTVPASSAVASELVLVLSGAVAQPYVPAAHSATMRPAQGDRAALQAALGEVERVGAWVVTVTHHGADAFAGSVSAALEFDWPGDGTDGVATCACVSDGDPQRLATEIAPSSQCRPLALLNDEMCVTGGGVVQGYSRRAVSCRWLPDRTPADLAHCIASDCALTAAQRKLLQGLDGTADATATSSCPFWQDCATAHRYEVGSWRPCSAECWLQRPDMTTQPFQRRNVTCMATAVEPAGSGAYARAARSGGGVPVPAVECEAAGLPDAPQALRACNTGPCPVGGCTYSEWGACSNTCGVGERTRTIVCAGSDPTCAPCTALRQACFSPCDECDANGGRGPCVFGACFTATGSMTCECEPGFTGELLLWPSCFFPCLSLPVSCLTCVLAPCQARAQFLPQFVSWQGTRRLGSSEAKDGMQETSVIAGSGAMASWQRNSPPAPAPPDWANCAPALTQLEASPWRHVLQKPAQSPWRA